ncbi:MAG: sigma 54-interacting transcriptional regulator [Desulfobacter sp.]
MSDSGSDPFDSALPGLEHLFPNVDPSTISLLPILDRFHEGVIVTDASGAILYMNALQEQMDDLKFSDVRGKKVGEVYRVDEDQSPVTRCLRTGERIENLACFYRTRRGKVVNSLHNVIPLRAGRDLIGTVCFIRAYSLMEKELKSASDPENTNYIRKRDRVGREGIKRLKNGTRYRFGDIIGTSPDLLAAIEVATLSAGSPSTVMLYGETGTGKELFAQSIHNKSRRRNKQYVALNCAAIPENLLEGILFGTAKGAFTGATDKAGLFERASGGTLFLDEINSMSMGLQAKLLRALQERKIRRVGALDEIPLDLKIISSVNEDPHQAVKSGRFRADLLYRLGVVFIRIPPLRERQADMDALVDYFIEKYNRIMDRRVKSVSDAVNALFRTHDWPGNVRELEHVIEGAMNLVKKHATIRRSHLSIHMGDLHPARAGQDAAMPFTLAFPAGEHTLQELPEKLSAPLPLPPGEAGLVHSRSRHEIHIIRQALGQTRGNVARAARQLKLSPQLLHYKLKKYGIDAKSFKPLMSPP